MFVALLIVFACRVTWLPLLPGLFFSRVSCLLSTAFNARNVSPPGSQLADKTKKIQGGKFYPFRDLTWQAPPKYSSLL